MVRTHPLSGSCAIVGMRITGLYLYETQSGLDPVRSEEA